MKQRTGPTGPARGALGGTNYEPALGLSAACGVWLSDDFAWAGTESTGGGSAVDSVNGQTGVVVLDADDVGALEAADIGVTVQAYDANLGALAANTTNGLWARTGAGTGSARTITAGTGISVSNGDGVSGNPTVTATAASTSAAGIIELATAAEQSSTTVLTSDDHRLLYSYPPDKCGSRTAAGNAAGSGTGFLEGITYFATPARNYITGFGHIDSNTSSTTADRGWYLTPATNSHLTFAKLMGSRVAAKFAVPNDNLRAFVAFTEAGAPTLVPANAANTLEVIRLGVYNNVFTWSISDGTNETTGSLTAVGHTAGTVYEYEIVWTSSTSVTFNIYNADRSTLLESTTRTTGIPASGSTTTCYIGVFIRTASTTPTVYYGLGRLRIP